MTDGRHAVRDRHTRQPASEFKRPFVDGGDRKIVNGVWDEQRADGFRIDARDHDFAASACVGEEAGSRSSKPSGRTAGEAVAPTRFGGHVVDSSFVSIVEHIASGSRCISHGVNARQTTAPIERPVAYGGDAAGEDHARQSTALTERTLADGGEAAGEGHARQTTAPIERVVADGGEAAGEGHARQSSAIPERLYADGGDATGEVHARQTTAPIERIVADGGEAAGEGHILQSTALKERLFADESDGPVVDCGWDHQVPGGFGITAGDGDNVVGGRV